MKKPTLYNYTFLALSQIMVSVGLVSSKYLLSHLPLFVILELRFAIATLILDGLGKVIYRGHNLHHAQIRKKDWWVIIAKGLSAGFLFNGLMLLGMRYTTASIAGIITSTLPAVVALMSFFILKEILKKRQWFCIGFAVVGIGIINMANFSQSSHSGSLLGMAFIMMALLPEAAYYILVKRFHTRVPNILLATMINGINALAFLPFSLYQLINTPNIHINFFMSFIFLISGIACGLFYVFWYMGSKNVPVSMASLFTAVMPISTIVIAWACLGESLHIIQFVGMVLILGSIALGTRSRVKAPE